MNGIEDKYEKILGQKHRDLMTAQTALRGRLDAIEVEMKKVFDLQLSMDDATVGHVFKDKIKALADEKTRVKGRLAEIGLAAEDQVSAKEAAAHVQKNADEVQRAWNKATPQLQRRLLRKVFTDVIADYEGLELHFRLPEDGLSTDSNNNSRRLPSTKKPASLSGAGLYSRNFMGLSPIGVEGVSGSLIDQIGRRGGI
ncbi:MAG: hypothetical protein ABIR96_05230 [Bdellovibrionota bacterium]